MQWECPGRKDIENHRKICIFDSFNNRCRFISHKLLGYSVATIQIYGAAQRTCPGHFHESNNGLDSPQVVRKLSQSCYPLKVRDFSCCIIRVIVVRIVVIADLVFVMMVLMVLLSRYSLTERFFQSKHEIVGETERGNINVRCGRQIDIEQITLDEFEFLVDVHDIACLHAGIGNGSRTSG